MLTSELEELEKIAIKVIDDNKELFEALAKC